MSVVSAGAAAEHSRIGCLNFSWWDPKRGAARLKQAGRGGVGTVFRDKKLKALVCRGPEAQGRHEPGGRLRSAPSTWASGSRRRSSTSTISRTRCGRSARRTWSRSWTRTTCCRSTTSSTASTRTSTRSRRPCGRSGSRRGSSTAAGTAATWPAAKGADCHVVRTGPYKGHIVTVDGPEYETVAGLGANCGIFDADWILESNFYCDTYGVDTISFGTACAFAMECYQRGILNKERTGGLELTWGNGEAHLELLHQMARGRRLRRRRRAGRQEDAGAVRRQTAGATGSS